MEPISGRAWLEAQRRKQGATPKQDIVPVAPAPPADEKPLRGRAWLAAQTAPAHAAVPAPASPVLPTSPPIAAARPGPGSLLGENVLDGSRDRAAAEAYEIERAREYVPPVDHIKQAGRSAVKGTAAPIASGLKGIGTAAASVERRWLHNDDFAPDDTFSYPIGKAIEQYVAEHFPDDPRLADDFLTTTLPQGLFSTLPYFAGGAASAATRGVPGVTAALMGAAGQVGTNYDEATAAGKNVDEASEIAMISAPIGALEGVPVERAFRFMGSGGLARAVKGFLEEGAQEGASTLGNNALASYTYDPDRALLEGAGEDAATGGITGALINAVLAGVARKRGRTGRSMDAPVTEAEAAAALQEAAAEVGAVPEAADTLPLPQTAAPIPAPQPDAPIPTPPPQTPAAEAVAEAGQAAPVDEQDNVPPGDARTDSDRGDGSAQRPPAAPGEDAGGAQLTPTGAPTPEAAAPALSPADAAPAVTERTAELVGEGIAPEAAEARAVAELRVVTEEDYHTFAAEHGTAEEIEDAYHLLQQQSAAGEEGSTADAIATALRERRVATSSFDGFSDPNLRKGTPIARTYLAKEGAGVDEIARTATEASGQEVTPQMVVDHVLERPSGKRAADPRLAQMQERYASLTGRKSVPQPRPAAVAESEAGLSHETAEAAPFRRSAPADGSISTEAAPRMSTAQVQRAANRAGVGASVAVVETEAELPAAVQERITRDNATGTVKGVYHDGKVYLVAANITSADEAARTLFHETVGHAGLRAVLGGDADSRLAAVYEAFAADPEMQRIVRAYGLDVDTESGRLEAAEEFVAHMAENAAYHKAPAFRRIVAAVRRWLRKAGVKVEMSRADIAALIAEAKRAGDRQTKGTRFKREILAPNGKPSNLNEVQHAQVRTPEFKAWFGDWENDPENASKVVDENGEPLVVYHGTKGDFDSFDVEASEAGIVHFGEVAQAEMRSRGAVVPVFLNVREPVRAKDTGSWSKKQATRWRGNGKDGVVYLNRYEGVSLETVLAIPGDKMDRMSDVAFRKAVPESMESWGVFSPNQIKSATGNSGTFDGANPDIRFSRTGADGPIGGDYRERVRRRIEEAIAYQGDGAPRAPSPGRPDLANPATSEPAREFVRAADTEGAADTDKQTFDEWDAAAARLPQHEVEAALKAGKLDSPAMNRAAMQMVDAAAAEAMRTGSPSAIMRASILARQYRQSRSESARVLASGRDPNETPETRRARVITGAVLDLDPRTERAINKAEKSAEAKRAREKAEQAAEAERALDAAREKAAEAEAREREAKKEIARLTTRERRADDRAAEQRDQLQYQQQRAREMEAELATLEREVTKRGRELEAARARAAELRKEATRLERKAQKKIDAAMSRHAERVEAARTALENIGVDVQALEGSTTVASEHEAQEALSVAWLAKGRAGHEMVLEYYRNALLSSPSTDVVNIVGNGINILGEYFLYRPLEALISTVVPGQKADAARLGEFRYLLKGLTPHAMITALRLARRAWTTEVPSTALHFGLDADDGTKFDERSAGAIPGKAGSVVRAFGYRKLLFADEIFKSLIVQAEVGAQAYRIALDEGRTGEAIAERVAELVEQKGSAAYARAFEVSKRLTFQDEAGPVAEAVGKASDRFWPFKFVLPFRNTPARIIATAVRRTPLGILPLAFQTAQYARGQASRGLVTQRAAEQLAAWSVAAPLLALIMGQDDDEPTITGTADWKSGGETGLSLRATPPTSVRIGDTYYDYSRLEPFGTTLAFMVDLSLGMKAAKASGDQNELWGKLIDSSVKAVTDQSFLRGIGDLWEALTGPDRSKLSWVSSFGASWMPNIIRRSLRARDPQRRDGRVESLGDLARATAARALPGLVHAAPKYDLWGRPIVEGERAASDYLYRLMTPVRVQSADAIPLDRLLLNWNAKEHTGEGDDKEFYPDLPRRFFIHRRERINMDADAYAEYVRLSGEIARTRLLEDLAAGRLDIENPTERDIKRIDVRIRAARERAKRAYINEHIRHE